MQTKLLAAICILGLLMSAGCISIGNNTEGIAKDKIARISYGGWIWKTWRVELLNDHPVSGDYGPIAQRYGVEDNATLIAQLMHYEETGETVKLYYRSHFFIFDWEFSDPDVIYRVEAVS